MRLRTTRDTNAHDGRRPRVLQQGSRGRILEVFGRTVFVSACGRLVSTAPREVEPQDLLRSPAAARPRLPLAPVHDRLIACAGGPPACGNTTGGPKPVNHASWPTDLAAFFHIQTADLQGARPPQEGKMATRRIRRTIPSLPPLLIRVIHAARVALYDDVDRTGHDAAVRELGQWALVQVPSRGVLAPSTDDAYKAIQDVATRHLQYRKARASFTNAVRAIESTAVRSDVESAQNWLQSESDTAYYYAGLACGITLADLATIRFDLERHPAWFEDGPDEP